jgi:hypothetical protein
MVFNMLRDRSNAAVQKMADIQAWTATDEPQLRSAAPGKKRPAEAGRQIGVSCVYRNAAPAAMVPVTISDRRPKKWVSRKSTPTQGGEETPIVRRPCRRQISNGKALSSDASSSRRGKYVRTRIVYAAATVAARRRPGDLS